MHTTTQSAAAAAEEILANMTMADGIHAEVLSSSLASTGGHAAHLVVWGPALRICPECGENEWPADRPCPVTIDSGGFGDLQMWSHQHGCGEWWSPPWTSRDLSSWEPTEDGVREAIEEIAQAVREGDEAEVADVEGSLRELLADVLAMLAEGGDVPDCLQGSELEPGVWRNGDQWEAWDFDPRDPEGAEAIVVTEHDLAKQ